LPSAETAETIQNKLKDRLLKMTRTCIQLCRSQEVIIIIIIIIIIIQPAGRSEEELINKVKTVKKLTM
jgi:hypothetical protein